jgi:hypothetical protein
MNPFEAGSADPDVCAVFMFGIVCMAITFTFAWVDFRKSIPMITDTCIAEHAVIVCPVFTVLVPSFPDE